MSVSLLLEAGGLDVTALPAMNSIGASGVNGATPQTNVAPGYSRERDH